jgi:hypothetical protein
MNEVEPCFDGVHVNACIERCAGHALMPPTTPRFLFGGGYFRFVSLLPGRKLKPTLLESGFGVALFRSWYDVSHDEDFVFVA